MEPSKTVNPNLVLRVTKPGEQSHDLLLDCLSRGLGPGSPFIRITGGCGDATVDDMVKAMGTIVPACDGLRKAVVAYGGTKMVYTDSGSTRLGITEVAPLIAERNENILLVGITPKIGEIKPYDPRGVVIFEDQKDAEGMSFRTIIHPASSSCYVIQFSGDRFLAVGQEERDKIWLEEGKLALKAALNARTAGMKPLLLVYNGGAYTKAEVGLWLQANLPVLAIRGSGRFADTLAEKAETAEFQQKFPNLSVCQNDVQSLREALVRSSVLAEVA